MQGDLTPKSEKDQVETLVKIRMDLPSAVSSPAPTLGDIDLHLLWSWDEFFSLKNFDNNEISSKKKKKLNLTTW